MKKVVFGYESFLKSEDSKMEGVDKLEEMSIWNTNIEVIANSCNDIKNSWYASKITVNENVCNDFEGDFSISGFLFKSLVVKKNSMKNLNSLTIKNNLRLESIVTEDGSGGYDGTDSRNTGAFYYVNSVIIRSLIDLIQLI